MCKILIFKINIYFFYIKKKISYYNLSSCWDNYGHLKTLKSMTVIRGAIDRSSLPLGICFFFNLVYHWPNTTLYLFILYI